MGADQQPSTVVRMVSKLEDREAFLDAYQAFVDPKSVVVFSRVLPPKGSRQRFSIHLKNGEVIFAGEGVVAERAPRTDGSNRPAKMRLNIVSLDPGGDDVLAELLERKRKVEAKKTPALPPPPPGPEQKADAEADTPPVGDTVAAAVKKLTEYTAEPRTPGAVDTLPANPLSNITDETLEGFVECVLFEDYEPDDERAETDADESKRPWEEEPEVRPAVPRVAKATPAEEPVAVAAAPEPASQPLKRPPTTGDYDIHVEPRAATAQPVAKSGFGTNLLIALLAGAAGVFGTFYFLRHDDTTTSAPATAQTAERPLVAARRAPAPAPPVDNNRVDPPAPAEPAATDEPKAAATVPEAAAPEAAATPEPEATPDSATDPPADPPAAAAAAADDGSCHIVVDTYKDAWVYLDGKRIAHPPLDREAPCGKPVIVAVKHPRYEEVERSVTPEPGKPAKVDVTLVRPDAKIKLSSVPSGATISVDGNIVGHAPARATIKAYTSVWVTASLDGYKPWSQRVRVSKRGGSFTARLVPIPGAR